MEVLKKLWAEGGHNDKMDFWKGLLGDFLDLEKALLLVPC